MEQFIEEIYKYSGLYTQLKKGIRVTHQFRMAYAGDIFNESYAALCDCCKACLDARCEYAMEFTRNVIQMSDLRESLTLLSDHVERKVLPFLKQWINQIADIDVDTEDGYRIQSTDSGYLTIQIITSGKYIHSTYDPMEEAATFIRKIFAPYYSEYILYGCGMGYYAYQIYQVTHGSVPITIYEKDPNLVSYARKYGVLDWVPDSVLNVVVSESPAAFLEHSRRKNVKPVFHIAELDSEEKAGNWDLVNLCIGENTSNDLNDIVVMNYYRNIALDIPDVTEIKGQILEEAVIVAAGPSLDQCMDYLRMCKGKRTIIAVNTVFKKLLQNGIVPDYVTVVDSSERMEKHLIGVENEQVPAILDLCAYWRWCHDYKGPKYRVYATYACTEAESYIKQNGKEKWPSGGTVTFLAMEFAYRMGSRKIYFIGTDLSYPEGKSHASGTAYAVQMNEEEMVEVDQVGGGKILTDYVMNRYRRAMETRIAQIGDGAEFYNLSTIGARIQGTVEISPERAMSV